MDKKRIIIVSLFIMFFILCILVSFLSIKNKYSITFETGSDDVILTKYVSKNEKVGEPVTPIKEGYIFKEWQLNGKTYDFDSSVTSNITLTAKWMKEEYITIKFDSKMDIVIDDIKILKGDKISSLPNLEIDGYEFVGWYFNGKLYSDDELYNDEILIAEFRKIENFIIGDTVIIVGEYASCANQDYAYNKKAIGWDRRILDIIDGANYPYVVGNDYGVTGFFKEESIKK